MGNNCIGQIKVFILKCTKKGRLKKQLSVPGMVKYYTYGSYQECFLLS